MKKFEYIGLVKNLSHKGKHNYGEVYANTKTQDGAISAYLLGQNIVPPARDKNPIFKRDMLVVICFALPQDFTNICLMRI